MQREGVLKARFRGLVLDESGASIVEYALLITLIGLACVAVLSIIGTRVAQFFRDAGNEF